MQNSESPYSGLSSEVKTAMAELDSDESAYVPQRPATELFRLDDCVQIFFVSSDGKVSTFGAPATLRIFTFQDKEEAEEWVPTFIQVGGWTHPLIPGASPALEAANGAFMFPDVYADTAATGFSAVGLVLPDDLPEEARAELRRLLTDLTALETRPQLPDDQQLGKIGRALVTSAGVVCQGMEFGAQKACELIEYVGEKERSKTAVADEDAKVGAGWRYTAKGAKYATLATVKVSGFVANRVGRLTRGLANYLAKKAEKPVTGAVVGVTGGGQSRSRSIHNLADAARGGLLAFGTVYSGLEEQAKVLGGCLKDNSVRVVQHRYGEAAGGVYGDAVTAAGNAALTYMNVSSLGVKGLVKRTAKDTGKALGKSVLEAHTTKD